MEYNLKEKMEEVGLVLTSKTESSTTFHRIEDGLTVVYNPRDLYYFTFTETNSLGVDESTSQRIDFKTHKAIGMFLDEIVKERGI